MWLDLEGPVLQSVVKLSLRRSFMYLPRGTGLIVTEVAADQLSVVKWVAANFNRMTRLNALILTYMRQIRSRACRTSPGQLLSQIGRALSCTTTLTRRWIKVVVTSLYRCHATSVDSKLTDLKNGWTTAPRVRFSFCFTEFSRNNFYPLLIRELHCRLGPAFCSRC